MNVKEAKDNLIKEDGWKLRTIGGVRVLQAPEDNADLIGSYDTLYWTDSDKDKIKAVLGEPDDVFGTHLADGSVGTTTLSYHCLDKEII